MVRDLDPAYPGTVPGSSFENANLWGSIGSRAFFTAHQASVGYELWATSGTAATTQLVADTQPGAFSDLPLLLTATPSLIYFRAGGGLWRTDGSQPGTYFLASDSFQSLTRENQVLSAGILYFRGCEGLFDCELWRTAGTLATTRRVRDIEPGFQGSDPRLFAAAAGRVIFAAAGGLWTTDGTESGTRVLVPGAAVAVTAAVGANLLFVVADPNGRTFELWAIGAAPAAPVRLGSFHTNPSRAFEPSDLRLAGSHAYFVDYDAQHGEELWRTDGSVAGTRVITNLPAPFSFTPPLSIAEVGNAVYFAALDEAGVRRLWFSQGSPETGRSISSGCDDAACPVVGDLRTELVPVSGRVVFLGTSDDGGADPRLWVSDGTEAGTRILGPAEDVFSLQPALGKVFFSATAVNDDVALWVTDGTRPGTRHLIDLGFRGLKEDFRVVGAGGVAYFASSHGPESDLYRTDGTAAGTSLVSIVGRAGAGSSPRSFAALNGNAVFAACVNARPSLWKSQGTAATTVPLSGQLNAGWCESVFLPVPEIVVSGDQAFVADIWFDRMAHEIWRTDLSGAGTRLIWSSPLGATVPVPVAGGVAFMELLTGGAELVRSDGTVAGTQPFLTFTGLGAAPQAFGHNRFVFAQPSAAPISDRPLDLWLSDGTLAGSIPLGPVRGLDGPLVLLGGVGYFLSGSFFTTPQLWRTDGTPAGTFLVFAPPEVGTGAGTEASHLVAFQGHVFFTAHASSEAWGIWRSDGTAAGTVPVVAFDPPGDSLGPQPESLTPVGNLLFFSHDDGVHGRELWVTDGTAAGTRLVVDLFPGAVGSLPQELEVFQGKLVFQANDSAHGVELWLSDGTAAGTRMPSDIAPGLLSSAPNGFTAIGGLLYFAADDGLHGRELWVLPAAGNETCQPSDTTLCLRGGRFEVTALWHSFQGNTGVGHAVPLTTDTGYFWFFNPANVETILKVLDGTGLNQHHWVFYGALSNVEYALTVRDTTTGASRRYYNPSGAFASVGDTQGFGPLGAYAQSHPPPPEPPQAIFSQRSTALKAACIPGAERLCLNNGRFAVTATWRDFAGNTGTGKAVVLTGDTGYFWFFNAANVEAVLKVLDGRPVNGKWWVFYGALSNVEYTLTVTDTETGAVKTYNNPSGRFASVGDTNAF